MRSLVCQRYRAESLGQNIEGFFHHPAGDFDDREISPVIGFRHFLCDQLRAEIGIFIRHGAARALREARAARLQSRKCNAHDAVHAAEVSGPRTATP
jgi:hypothetical protein